MNWESAILWIVPFILGIGFIGAKVTKVLNILGKVTVVLKELADLFDSVIDAFKDKKLTPEETEKCMQEWKEVVVSVKATIDSIKALVK